jgi:hypothetical protein
MGQPASPYSALAGSGFNVFSFRYQTSQIMEASEVISICSRSLEW